MLKFLFDKNEHVDLPNMFNASFQIVSFSSRDLREKVGNHFSEIGLTTDTAFLSFCAGAAGIFKFLLLFQKVDTVNSPFWVFSRDESAL